MGAEFLVAILWGVVVIYWLWSRRPALGDSIGLFHHELYALEHATPTRVPPANRRRPLPYAAVATGSTVGSAISEPVFYGAAPPAPVPAGPGPVPAALAATVLSAKRLVTRRRRRDIISGLLVIVLVSLVATVVTRSVAALSFQALSDLALGAYAYLLVTRTKATATAAKPIEPKARLSARAEPDAAPPAEHEEDWLVDLVGLEQEAASYTPAHALPSRPGATVARRSRPAVWRAIGGFERSSEAYGDFDSYASLALAQAN